MLSLLKKYDPITEDKIPSFLQELDELYEKGVIDLEKEINLYKYNNRNIINYYCYEPKIIEHILKKGYNVNLTVIYEFSKDKMPILYWLLEKFINEFILFDMNLDLAITKTTNILKTIFLMLEYGADPLLPNPPNFGSWYDSYNLPSLLNIYRRMLTAKKLNKYYNPDQLLYLEILIKELAIRTSSKYFLEHKIKKEISLKLILSKKISEQLNLSNGKEKEQLIKQLRVSNKFDLKLNFDDKIEGADIKEVVLTYWLEEFSNEEFDKFINKIVI